eukprot:3446726-Pleurochrysis_carterae.AAC.2
MTTTSASARTANYTVTLVSDTLVYVVTNESDTVVRAMGQVGQVENLVHACLGHFSIDRINASVDHGRGIESICVILIQTLVLA